MAYADYLPGGFAVGEPKMQTVTETVGSSTVPRRYFDCGTVSFYENSYSGTEAQITDTADEYQIGGGTGTVAAANDSYQTGDVVKIDALGLKFKYAATDNLVVDASNFDEYHPCAVDEFGYRTATAVQTWSPMGHTEEYKPLNGSDESYLTFANGGRVEVETGWTYTEDPDGFVGLLIDGISYEGQRYPVTVTAFVEIWDAYDILVDSFSVGNVGSKFFLRIPRNNELSALYLGDPLCKISVTLSPLYSTSVTLASTLYVGSVSICSFVNVGTPLLGVKESPIVTARDLLSDGVRQEEIMSAYDTLTGKTLVDKEDYKAARNALKRASVKQSVAYIGAEGDTDYVDIAYRGRVKFGMPIEDGSGKHKVDVTVTARPYFVENDFITLDSTQGYTL